LEGDLLGTIPDIAATYSLFLVSLQIAIQKIFVDVDAEAVKRSSVLKSLEELFDLGTEFAVVYYTGHGQAETGGWCFEEPGATGHTFITYNDVAKRWHARKQRSECQKLYLIVDACFSGIWVAAAKQDDSIVVQASAGETDLAAEDVTGGLWTSLWTRQVATLADYRNPEIGLLARVPSLPVRATGNANADTSRAGQRWLVVAQDGVVVREGVSLYSKQMQTKLANGTLITELGSKGNRLQYSKASLGSGPDQGWITTGINGKELVMKSARAPATAIMFTWVAHRVPTPAKSRLQEAEGILNRARPGWDSEPNSPVFLACSRYISMVSAWEKLIAAVPSLADDCLVLLPHGLCILAALFAAGSLTFKQGLLLSLRLGDACQMSFAIDEVWVSGLTEETLDRCCLQVKTERNSADYCAIDTHMNPLLYLVKCARDLRPALVDACHGHGEVAVRAQASEDRCLHTPIMTDFAQGFYACLDVMMPTIRSPSHVIWDGCSMRSLGQGCPPKDIRDCLRNMMTHPVFWQSMVTRSIQEDSVGVIYELG
jgi:hypothetical protein